MSSKLDWDYINSILEGTEAEKASEPKKSRDPKENRAVIKFIKDTNIQPGPNKVPTTLIFYQFRLWCQKAGFYSKNGLTEFFRHFKKYFDQVRDGKQRYYLLNDSIEISEIELEKARKHRNMYNGLRRSYREKGRKKKQIEVSSTEEGTKSEIS